MFWRALWQPHLWHHLSHFTSQVNTLLILIQSPSPRGLLWEIPQHLDFALSPIPRVNSPRLSSVPAPFLYPSGLTTSLDSDPHSATAYGALISPYTSLSFFLLLGLSTFPSKRGPTLPRVLGMSPMEVLSLSPKLYWLFNQQTQEREGSSFFKQNGIRCVIWLKKNIFLAMA